MLKKILLLALIGLPVAMQAKSLPIDESTVDNLNKKFVAFISSKGLTTEEQILKQDFSVLAKEFVSKEVGPLAQKRFSGEQWKKAADIAKYFILHVQKNVKSNASDAATVLAQAKSAAQAVINFMKQAPNRDVGFLQTRLNDAIKGVEAITVRNNQPTTTRPSRERTTSSSSSARAVRHVEEEPEITEEMLELGSLFDETGRELAQDLRKNLTPIEQVQLFGIISNEQAQRIYNELTTGEQQAIDAILAKESTKLMSPIERWEALSDIAKPKLAKEIFKISPGGLTGIYEYVNQKDKQIILNALGKDDAGKLLQMLSMGSFEI